MTMVDSYHQSSNIILEEERNMDTLLLITDTSCIRMMTTLLTMLVMYEWTWHLLSM